MEISTPKPIGEYPSPMDLRFMAALCDIEDAADCGTGDPDDPGGPRDQRSDAQKWQSFVDVMDDLLDCARTVYPYCTREEPLGFVMPPCVRFEQYHGEPVGIYWGETSFVSPPKERRDAQWAALDEAVLGFLEANGWEIDHVGDFDFSMRHPAHGHGTEEDIAWAMRLTIERIKAAQPQKGSESCDTEPSTQGAES